MDSDTCSAAPELCTGPTTTDENGGALQQLAVLTAGALSTMGLSTILLLQLDGISRRLLSPPRLLAKRRQEYRYAVTQCGEYSSLMIRQHVGGGKGVCAPKVEAIVWEKMSGADEEEMMAHVEEILDVTKATPVIVAMEQDLEDKIDPNQYHLYLAFPPGKDTTTTPAPPAVYRRVRVPLVVFCEKLASAFEGQMTSTALCFVADASSGMGSEMLTTVVKDCNHGLVSLRDAMSMCSLLCILLAHTHHELQFLISNRQRSPTLRGCHC